MLPGGPATPHFSHVWGWCQHWERPLSVWIFRGIDSHCTGNVSGKFTCYLFSFSHAKLFPGTEFGSCLFMPLCCLQSALLFVAFLEQTRKGWSNRSHLLCLWVKTSSLTSRVTGHLGHFDFPGRCWVTLLPGAQRSRWCLDQLVPSSHGQARPLARSHLWFDLLWNSLNECFLLVFPPL